MHARRLVPAIAAALFFFGCEGPERERRAPDRGAEAAERAREGALAEREREASAPTRGAAPDPAIPRAQGACSLGEPREALAREAPALSVGLAHGEGVTVLVAAIDEATLEWVELDAAGAPTRRTRAPFPRAGGLVGAAAWGPDTVAVGHGPCARGEAAASCLHVAVYDGEPPEGTRAVPSSGRVAQLAIPLARPVARLRFAASERLFVVARSHAEGPAFVDLVRRAPDGLAVESVAVEGGAARAELHAEVLAAAADGERYAVAVRVGAIENPAGALLLATREGVHEVEALHEAAMVDAIAFDPARPGALALLASFEWSRPGVFRVDARGELLGAPVEVAHGAEVGRPFDEAPVARLDRDDAGLVLRRATRAGDALGPPVRIAGPAPMRAAAARREDDVLVALAPRDAPYGVRTVAVRCAR